MPAHKAHFCFLVWFSLQNGIFVDVTGREQKLSAKLVVIMRDNLSSHALTGFQVHFNSIDYHSPSVIIMYFIGQAARRRGEAARRRRRGQIRLG